MAFIYRLIALFIIINTIWIVATTEDKKTQALGAMTLIPFVLRFLMIK